MTEIYFSTISECRHDELMSKYLSMFSESFSDRLLMYYRWEDAQLSLLGRLLLKYGFEKNNYAFSEADIVFSPFKKPLIKNHPLQFNISHSGNVVACVVSDLTDVGIDVELIKPIDLNDFKTYMTCDEWIKVAQSRSRYRAFYDYWTQKEAVLKAMGSGLLIPLNSFSVDDNTCQMGNDSFVLQEVTLTDDYKCHIALMNNDFDQELRPIECIF